MNDMIYGVSHGQNMLRRLFLEESWIPLSSTTPLPPNDLVAVVDKDGSQIFRSPYAVTPCRGVH